MITNLKNLLLTGLVSIIIASAASAAYAGSLKQSGSSRGEPACKPEWTHCVCMLKPLGGGKVCWNDALTTNTGGNSGNTRQSSPKRNSLIKG